jgi:hypothetical protein
MGKLRMITIDGVTLSLKEWAERAGISVGAVYARLKRGWSIEKALTTSSTRTKYAPGFKVGKWTLIKDTGQRYNRYVVWEVVCECGYVTTFPGAYLSPSRKPPVCPICGYAHFTALGKTQSVRQWSEETGIPISTLKSRLRKGMDPDEIISKPKNYQIRLITHDGKTQNMSQWADEIGISREAMRQRLLRMDPEKAVTLGKQESRKQLEIRGRSQSIKEWAEEVGTTYQTIYQRLFVMGWPPEDAVFGRSWQSSKGRIRCEHCRGKGYVLEEGEDD